jgi:hypothetical protein
MRAAIVVGMALASAGAGATPIASAPSVTLSPAVVPLGGRAGQSTSQRLTVRNATGEPLGFTLVARDVVVRDGRRALVDAGELRGSVAATAVFSTPSVVVGPGEARSVDVTLTLPPQMTTRAVVILFQGTTRIGGSATVSLGSLVTFDLAGRQSLAAGELRVAPPSASTNAGVALPVVNDGSEPAIVRGAAVILDAGGAVVGKLALEPRRLLPGERGELRADHAGELRPGRYRVIATIEGAWRSWTRTAELEIP